MGRNKDTEKHTKDLDELTKAERIKVEHSKESLAMTDLICGGLIATSLVILQVLISLSKLDIVGFISVLAFAESIPLLSGKLLLNFFRRLPKKPDMTIGIGGFYAIGPIAAIVGISAAFWHVSWIAGVVL
jgi:hypothetical protein